MRSSQNPFKGHAVFVWKKPSGYSFAWLADTDLFRIPRKSVLNAEQISEYIFIDRMKQMKGVKKTIRLIVIKDPHSENFTDINSNPMAAKEDFLDLISRLKLFAEKNKINLLILDMGFYPDPLKGHAVFFVWKKASDYSFVWLFDRRVFIPRKSILTAEQVSECMVTELIKKMKGLKQTIRLVLIEDPRSQNFTNSGHNPLVSRENFLDLISRLEILAEENQIDLLITDTRFYPVAFKGHAVFVWKKSPDYLFAWTFDRDAPIPRKSVLKMEQLSESVVIERVKQMKGLKEQIRLILIENPRSHNFTNMNHNPMLPKEDFLDLIHKLEKLAQENQVRLLIDYSKSHESIRKEF